MSVAAGAGDSAPPGKGPRVNPGRRYPRSVKQQPKAPRSTGVDRAVAWSYCGGCHTRFDAIAAGRAAQAGEQFLCPGCRRILVHPRLPGVP